MSRPSLIERAYQLADSGACRTVTDVKKRLAAEGYPPNELIGKSLIDGLLRRCRQASGLPAEKPMPPTPLSAADRAARALKAAATRRANRPSHPAKSERA